MIDIHCHILPGIDDGSPDMECSLTLARQAVSDGITHIIATPHFRYPIQPEEQLVRRGAAYVQLTARLAAEHLPLTLSMAGEFQVDQSPFDTLKRYPAIGYPAAMDGPLLAALIELPPEADVLRAGDILFQQQLRADAPERIIIAHPERQPGFVEHLPQLKELVERGLCLQFNAMTFTRTFWWRKVIRGAIELMAAAPSQIYLATDAHDPVHRPCILSVAKKAIVKALGEAAWKTLTEDNPGQLIQS